MRVENAYLATLPPEQQAEAAAQNAATAASLAALGSLPWPVVELRYAPYRLGPMLLRIVYARSGNQGVDALLQHPPPEEVLISPWKYQQGETEVEVNVPAPEGAHVVQSSRPLSMMQLLVMLDAWLPWTMSRGALDGWSGGGYVTYHRDGATGPLCFSAIATFQGPTDGFVNAINWWATLSGSGSTPVVNGNSVGFISCARGTAAVAPAAPVIGTDTAIAIENDAIPADAILTTDASAGPFLCTARLMIDDPNAAPLLVAFGRTPEQQATVDNVRAAAAAFCGL
jgi:hypothetical protein